MKKALGRINENGEQKRFLAEMNMAASMTGVASRGQARTGVERRQAESSNWEPT